MLHKQEHTVSCERFFALCPNYWTNHTLILIFPIIYGSTFIPNKLFTASILCALTLDTVGHACQPGEVPCLFSLNSTSGHNILLDYRLVLLPGILGGLAWPFVAIGVYKFICAQSPHQTKGTFIGIYYCMLGVGFALGFLLMLPFYLQSSINWPVSCGFWYYLINAMIMLAGFFIFSVVAKHYKQRKRDDPSFEQANIEAYYEAKVSL